MLNTKLSRSNFIHLLRWTAAFLVVFNHLRSIVFKDYPRTHINRGILTKVFYFISGLGHQAVIVFFVLSGYLIAGSVINQLRKGNFDIKLYSLNRISRLYAVLVIALILTVVLDHVGITLDRVGLYTNKIETATLGFSIADRLSVKHFLSSLFMLQTIVLPPLGSNSPLWSLAAEFWYYVIFPCLSLAIFYIKKESKNAIIPCLILILLLLFLPAGVFLFFLIWLLGLIPFYITIDKFLYKLLFSISFLIWLFLKKVIYIDNFWYDFVLGVIVAFWLASFVNYDQPSVSFKLRMNEKLSSFSYTTYLVHFPLIMLALTICQNLFFTGISMEPNLISYLIFTIVFLLVISSAYFIATLTEFKTSQVRAVLSHAFKIKKRY